MANTPEAQESELDYLRRHKETSNSTIAQQIKMIQFRESVIQGKDQHLDSIVALANRLIMATPTEHLSTRYTRDVMALAIQIKEQAMDAKGVGIKYTPEAS